MNKETVNEQRNSIILYTYIQDIQLSKGSIYHNIYAQFVSLEYEAHQYST